MARIYTTFLSFVTGMVLSFVGAAFILGKLREAPSSASAEGKGVKLAFTSASPGLILAALGTTLMVVAVMNKGSVSVEDKPLYLSESSLFSPAPEQSREQAKPESPSPSLSTDQQRILEDARRKLQTPAQP